MVGTYFITLIWTEIRVGGDSGLVQDLLITTGHHLLEVMYVNSLLVFRTALAIWVYQPPIRRDKSTASQVYFLHHARRVIHKSVYIITANHPAKYLK